MQTRYVKRMLSTSAFVLSMCAGMTMTAHHQQVYATELGSADAVTVNSEVSETLEEVGEVTSDAEQVINSSDDASMLQSVDTTTQMSPSESEVVDEAIASESIKRHFEKIEAKYQAVEPDHKVTLIVQYDKVDKATVLGQVRAISDANIKYEYEEVFDGASVEIPVKDLYKLRTVKGLSFVEESQRITPQMAKTGELVNNLKQMENYPHDGRGMVIAIIDSGIDTRHKDMRLDAGIVPKITKITETVEKEYTLKIPHGYNYVGNNNQLIDETEFPHGMHIAGILAGNATDEEIANNTGIDGIAPNAQLLMYRVFSDREDTQVAVIDDTVFAAMEDAIKHGADVISLSIGSYGTGKPGDAFYKAVERAKAKGIVVVASIGNAAGSSSTTSYDKYGNNAFDQKDVATTVSVAANLDVIGVGSTRNKYQINHKMQVGETELYYVPVSYSSFKNGDYEFVHVGTATAEELKDVDLAGKVAIVGRSSEDAKVQFDRLRNKDVIGIVSYNNDTGRNRDFYETEMQQILQENVALDLWGVTISHQDGQKLLELIQTNATLSVKNLGVKYSMLADDHEVSGFSSWGTTLDLELKPEIVAPGERIYSTLNHNRYGIMSGTSMSTPVVAAAATILLPKFREMARPADINITDFTKIMMMNTADPVFDTTKVENSPRQQGAGMLNITDAFNNNVLLTSQNKGAATLKEIGDMVEFKVKLTNMKDEIERFTLRKGKILTSANIPVTKSSGEVVKEIHSVELEGATLTANMSTIELQPGESKEVTFMLNTTGIMDKFVEGYLYFDSDTNPSLAMPYFGYKGDWHNASIIDPPTWEANSKTKLTALMSTYRDNSKVKYKPLGLEDVTNVESNVNPDLVAMNSQASNGFTSSAFIRLGVMRDVLDYDIDIVTEPSETVRSLRIIDRGNILERFRYIDYFENDFYRKMFSNPNSEKFNWDGKLYDATTGTMVSADEGQYYVRVKVRNDKTKNYQYTYLPIKVDNTAPTLNVEKQDTQYTIRTADNNRIWFVKAVVDGKEMAVTKVAENHYQLVGIDPNTMHNLRIEAVDIAGNITKHEEVLSIPLIQFTNLDDIRTNRRQRTLEAKVKDNVTNIEASIAGRNIPVTITQQEASFNLASIKNGAHQLHYILKNADGEVLAESVQSFIRDTQGPIVTFDLETEEVEEDDEEYEIVKSEKGYAIIKGRVTDALTPSKEIKVTYYLPKDRLKRDIHQTAPVDEEGNFEFRAYLSDFPSMINVDFTDSSGNRVTHSLLTAVPKDEHISTSPILVSDSLTNNFLKHENLEDNLELVKGENGAPDKYRYVIRFFTHEEGYSVRINDGELREIEDSLNYEVLLNHGANVLNLEGYDSTGKLVFQRRLNYFVDINPPTYEIENLRIMPIEEGESNRDVIGTVYFSNEENLLKGYAEDDGLEWGITINRDTVKRGKAWREFGQNREHFEYRLFVKDNDLLSLRLYDFHGNETNHKDEKYRVRIDKEKPTITTNAQALYKTQATFNIEVSDNIGIARTTYLLDGEEYDPNSTVSTLGEHVLSIVTEDYAGNQTTLEQRFTIIDALSAQKVSESIRFPDIANLQKWLQPSIGTHAELVNVVQENNLFRVTVRLFNDLGEETSVEYQLLVAEEEAVPNNAPIVELPIAEIEKVADAAPIVELPIAEIEKVADEAPMIDLPIAPLPSQEEMIAQMNPTVQKQSLPTTGESAYAIFNVAAMSILASIGLITRTRKEQ
ncbi:S8 family serine peptidase [Aerococcaceae bacterium NML191219]|nr:S8 family serine peptidase [Aerococcaceae bacterium NML191219]